MAVATTITKRCVFINNGIGGPPRIEGIYVMLDSVAIAIRYTPEGQWVPLAPGFEVAEHDGAVIASPT